MSESKRPESAIVALISEAENLVEPFRRRYDPSAAAGVPAHVTILYPFKPPHALTDDVIESLRRSRMRHSWTQLRPAFTPQP